MRKFVAFDPQVIYEEMVALDKSRAKDLARLLHCMKVYEETEPHANPSPAIIKPLTADIQELRHFQGKYKGRLAFYPHKAEPNLLHLVMLVVFRKESQKTPPALIHLAESRR